MSPFRDPFYAFFRSSFVRILASRCRLRRLHDRDADPSQSDSARARRRDVVGSAQTGTGKTAAFALPILQRLSTHPRPTGNAQRARCLVLCPTRELATQIADGFRVYGKNLRIRQTIIFGGVGQNPQVAALKHGTDVIVATPGRLLDLMNQGHVDLRGIEILVLDEADRMLDLGFINDIRKIVARVPAKRQTLLFSATMPNEIRQLADTLMTKPVTVNVAPGCHHRGEHQPVDLLRREGEQEPASGAPRRDAADDARYRLHATKHGADKVVRSLHTSASRPRPSTATRARTPARERWKTSGRARSPFSSPPISPRAAIDIDDITHVVNYDLTHEPRRTCIASAAPRGPAHRGRP